MGLFQKNPNLIRGGEAFAKGVAKTIKNTNISSALMTAASIYFQQKEKEIWYFSPATNLKRNTEIIDKSKTITLDKTVTLEGAKIGAAVDKLNRDIENALNEQAMSESDVITLGNSNLPVEHPLAEESVLPEAYFIDMSLDYNGQVVNAPIELGSYNAYNKTSQPVSIEATLAFDENKGKGILMPKPVASISSVIDRLVLLKKSPILFSIITPYYEYENMTLESFSYSYTMDNGLGVLFVKAKFKEVPQIGVLVLEPGNVKDSGCADVKNIGMKETKNKSALAIGWDVATGDATLADVVKPFTIFSFT